MSDHYEVVFEENGARAVLRIFSDGRYAELATISSKYRRRGFATLMMLKALDYADFLNREVLLEVQPFGDGIGMRDHELKSWYMTFGFVNEGNDMMSRRPISERVQEETTHLLEEAKHADKDNESSSDPRRPGSRIRRDPDGGS